MSTPPDPEAPIRTFRGGDWFGILGERAVVALPPGEKARVAALWELVDGGAGFDVTLDALISGGLRDLPAFVLVSTADAQTQVVLRGSVRAELTVADETVRLDGGEAATWVERTVAGVEAMSLVLDPDAAAVDGPAYSVDRGLVRLSRLDEAPAHEGSDETGEEPAYEREFPLAVAEEPVRSPEPPSWTPAPVPPAAVPPAAVPPDPVPPPPVAPVPPPLAPPPLPDVPSDPVVPDVPVDPVVAVDPVDHDGLTVTGAWHPPLPTPPGIPGQPPAPDVTRPVARLELSTGEVYDVDRAIVFGRAPEARRFSATEQPLMVVVHSPRLEVSSTHLEVRPGTGADHGSAVATDLGSTNGTVLVQAGVGAQDLTPGEAVQLLPGAMLDLGDGVRIRVASPPR